MTRSTSLRHEYGVEAVAAVTVLLAVAAFVVPTWLLGGFRRVDTLPRIEARQQVSYGEVSITPLSARVLTAHTIRDTPITLLVVTVRAENRLATPFRSLDELVTIEEPVFDEPKPPTEAAVAGTGEVGTGLADERLEPALPRTVLIAWRVPRGTSVDDIEVTLYKRSYTEDLYADRRRWQNPEPWVVATLPVESR